MGDELKKIVKLRRENIISALEAVEMLEELFSQRSRLENSVLCSSFTKPIVLQMYALLLLHEEHPAIYLAKLSELTNYRINSVLRLFDGSMKKFYTYSN